MGTGCKPHRFYVFVNGKYIRVDNKDFAYTGTTWQQRLVEEKIELECRLKRLVDFIGKDDTPDKVTHAEWCRLCHQRDAMRAYLAVLEERIAAAKE